MHRKNRLTFVMGRLAFACVVLACSAHSSWSQQTELPESIAKWEADIAALEQVDDQEAETRDAILFVGSSSIRRWKSLADDMQPWTTLRRGYGGARLTDLNHYASRLIGPHLGKDNPRRCRAVVIFVANDISGKAGQADPSPQEVAQRFCRLHQWIRQQDPAVPMFWIEVTPCNKRWHVWPQIQQATGLIREQIDRDPTSYFIHTAGAFLGPDDHPNDDWFVDDRLHLNEDGYQLWSGLIKSHLQLRLGAASSN